MNTVVILYHNYWQQVRNSGNVHMVLMRGNVDQCTLHWWDSGEKLVLSFTVTGDLISSNPQGGTKPHVPNLSDCREPREQGRQTQSCSRVESAYSLYCTFLFGFALTTSWHDVYAVQKTHCLVVLPFTPWKPEITTYTRLLSIQVHILYFFIYFSFSFYHQWQCLQHASKSSFWQTTNKLKHIHRTQFDI